MSLTPIIATTRELSLGKLTSNLNANATAGLGSISVYSITSFAVNKILCIGEYGSEGAEIIKTHAATAPTGYTVTLAANLAKSHPKDSPVYILAFDQIEFSHADTLAGAKTVMGSVTTINPEKDTMLYEDVTNTTGFYFTRYYNSITDTYSDYSDGSPYTGMAANTVGFAIDTALSELGAVLYDKLTYSMCINWANQMLRMVRGKMKTWSKYQEFGYVVDTIDHTVASYDLPTTIYDKNSNKSILNVRIEDNLPLTFIDRNEYLQNTADMVSGDEVDDPRYYSVWDGKLYLWPYGTDDLDGDDILMDFYTDIETIDSDSDVILGTKFDMLIPFLKWKIRAVTENNGLESLSDPSYLIFRELLSDAIQKEESGNVNAFRPRSRNVQYIRDNDLTR